MSQIQKKFLKADSVDESKILLLNDGALRARNAADSADVELMKLDGADKLQLLVLPQVSSDPVAGNDLVRKSHLDSELATAAADVTALEGRVTAIEDDYGVAGGLATLDGAGLVPTTQLPSYVDDVLEFADLASFPATGETGKIYVAIDTSKCYRWSGSVYIQITSGAVDSVNGQTGVVVLDTEDVLESGDSRYYTAARQAAVEAYADQAEADAIAAANLYTDGEVAILEAEDLTFLKLDGSRSMTGNLDLDGNSVSNVASVVSVAAADLNLDTGNQLVIKSAGTQFGAIYSDGGNLKLESTAGMNISTGVGQNFGVLAETTSISANSGIILDAMGADLEIKSPTGITLNTDAAVILKDYTNGDEFGQIIKDGAGLNVYSVDHLLLDSDGIVQINSAASAVQIYSGIDLGGTDVLNASSIQSATGFNLTASADVTLQLVSGTGPVQIQAAGGAGTQSVEIDGLLVSYKKAGVAYAELSSDIGNNFQLSATTGDLVLGSTTGIKASAALSMETHQITNVVDPISAQDAATKNYVDLEVGAEETRALAAESVLDGRATALEGRATALEAASLEWQPIEKFTLTAPMIAAGYVELSFQAVEHSIMASVDRLMIHHTDDYTVSVVSGKTRLTFVGSLVTPGQEKLAAGDVIRVQACKVAIV